ncbi:MAG TPA: hypothetical protein VGS98_03350 [Thermoanaerobaculia bacterium]|jgi:hypothetical protein|nr:hypothetical protein [Thermoanaerobaculia bacterium]
MPRKGRTKDWVDVETLQILSRHLTGDVPVIATFWVIRLVLKAFLEEGWLLRFLLAIDTFLILVMVLFLVYKLLRDLWRAGVGPGKTRLLVA